MKEGTPLPIEFYLDQDVVRVAKKLLGKTLLTRIQNRVTKGIIVETEAYSGINDKACHARNGKRTPRNEVMYEEGGISYVYLCYGIHHLFNVVTNREGIGDAVLIRGLEPISGIDTMVKRRKLSSIEKRLTAGPSLLSEAMGITLRHNRLSLLSSPVQILESGNMIPDSDIVVSTRVGVQSAGEDAFKPWRFRIKNNMWCSPAK